MQIYRIISNPSFLTQQSASNEMSAWRLSEKNSDYDKETARRSPKGQVLLVLWWGFAECGNRKALRLRAQGVYSYK